MFSNFNSSMVRLKVGDETPYKLFKKFQFQYGAIKSSCRNKSQNDIPYFNSSMVRLKVFNYRICNCSLLYFNSSMVRLKGRNKNVFRCYYSLFQFQYGAIKSGISKVIPLANVSEFQFQYGAIKSLGVITTFKSFRYFNSSMVRLKANRRCSCFALSYISIPVWCD